MAQARLPRALLELHKRISDALRASPKTDPVTAEAMEYRGSLARLKAGDTEALFSGSPETFILDDGSVHEVALSETALGFTMDALEAREEAIRRTEGADRAAYFTDLALGRTTPFAFHLDTWLAEPGKRGVRRERTNMEFRGIAEAFSAWLVAERVPAAVERVTRAVAGRYLGHLHKIGRSPKRVRDVASALSGYWQWMMRRGHVPDGVNPWARQEAGSPGESGGREGTARAFTASELRKMIDGTDEQPVRDMVLLLALTGMRIEEACQLQIADCADGVFTVRRGKTGAAARNVPIHPDLAALVAGRCAGSPAKAWLFPELGDPDKYGRRSPTLDARLNRYRQSLGIEDRPEGARRSRVTVHSFRRWFITEALRADQDIRVVRQVVGHKPPSGDVTVGTYFGGDLPAALRACVEAVKLPPAGTEGQPQGA